MNIWVMPCIAPEIFNNGNFSKKSDMYSSGNLQRVVKLLLMLNMNMTLTEYYEIINGNSLKLQMIPLNVLLINE